MFPYKPSILGYHHSWKPPYMLSMFSFQGLAIPVFVGPNWCEDSWWKNPLQAHTGDSDSYRAVPTLLHGPASCKDGDEVLLSPIKKKCKRGMLGQVMLICCLLCFFKFIFNVLSLPLMFFVMGFLGIIWSKVFIGFLFTIFLIFFGWLLFGFVFV